MKKRVFTRILIVALVCTMLLGLVGFAPMVETAAASAGEQKVAAAANDGGTSGEVKDQPEQEQPTPTPAPTQEPEPEPTDDPQPGMCKVTIEQPDGGEITCTGLPKDGQVKAGTELTFTVSEDETAVSSTFRKAAVNGKVVEDVKGGKFAVVVEENITVTAEFFGIQSVTVSDADKWTRSKTVTVKTIGSVDSMTYQTTDGEAVPFDRSFEVKDEIGEKPVKYTITVNGGGQTAETTVEVSKIDSTCPRVTAITEEIKNKRNRVVGYKCTVTMKDAGSGVNKNSFLICEKKLIKKDTEYTLNDFKGKVTDQEDGSVVFTFSYKNNRNYYFVISDNAGNQYKGDNVADTIAPKILGYGMEPGSDASDAAQAAEVWWAGNGAILTVRAQDDSDIQFFALNEATPVECGKDQDDEHGEYEWAKFRITKSGEYTVRVADKSGNTAEETITVKYDPNAPVFESAKYTTSADDSWFKGLLNKLTNGGLFSEKVGITVVVNDVVVNDSKDGKDDKGNAVFASGVAKVEYRLVEKKLENAPADKAESDGSASQEKWKGTELVIKNGKASIPIKDDFTGYIELCATDNAGNERTVTVEYDKENPDNTGKLEITNKATYSGEGDLIVMAKTGDGENQKAYTKDGDAGKPEDVRSVDFDIYTTAPDLPEETHGTTEITKKDKNGNDVKESVATTTTYSYGEPTVTATYGEGKNLKVEQVELPENGDSNAKYTASIGKNGDVRFDGVVTFTVTYKIKATTTIDGTGEVTGTPSELEKKQTEQTVSVPVRVQNDLDAPVIELGGIPNDNGWFNSYGHRLTSVNLKTPDGLAKVTTDYTIWYWENDQSEKDAVVLLKTDKTADKTTGTITNAAGGNVQKPVDTELFEKDTLIQKAGHYKITAVSHDEIGNSKEAKSLVFKYDPKPADICVAFTENHTGKDEFFNILRTAEITVKDETFTGSEDEVKKITPTFVYEGAKPQQVGGKWTFTKNIDEPGGFWTATYQYGVKLGETLRDGDNYMLTVEVTDNAGNTSRTDNKGNYYINGSKTAESEASHYTGDANDDFTIDQTKPVVSVRFDNNNVRNGKYFSAGRTATITVTEHNFSTENVEMTATNATVGGSASEGWSQNGDVWTKTVTFDPQDAVCEFSISVTDLAGNTCTNDEVNYGDSAAHGEFVIDQVNPTLNITGTDASPYADDCAPGFTAHDTNMSAEYTMTLDRTVRASRNENVSDRFLTRDSVSVTGTDINAVFHTITQEAENDGIYVLNVTATDMAGNSSQATATFTVNRHGSFYVFNEALADVVNAKYVQKAGGSYQVTEYNASPLVADSVKIEIYRDGQLVTTLTPAIGAGVIGASGLYEYTYDLPAEHFAQNGRYRVALSSVDEAKNESDNTKLDDALLEFTVDSVAPEITMIKGLEKGIVNAKSLDFTASVMDTYGIASVQILVDGKVVKEYVTQEAYDKLTADGRTLDHEYVVLTNTLDFNAECTLLESGSRQHVVIVVTDMAGNVTQTDSKDFAPAYDFHDSVLVSTNFWARYTHNVWALIVTGVVILAVAGGVWYVTAKKKKEQMAA